MTKGLKEAIPGGRYVRACNGMMDLLFGGVVMAGVLKRRGYKLIGIKRHMESALKKMDGYDPEVVESLSDARKLIAAGNPALLSCVVVNSTSTFTGPPRNKNLHVYPSKGSIDRLMAIEFDAGDRENPEKSARKELVSTHDSFHLEGLEEKRGFLGCLFSVFPDEHEDYVHVLAVPACACAH